jgi:thymidylate synthase
MSRIFSSFKEAVNELKRDLAELSVKLPASTWQGKDVSQDEGYAVKELQNCLYTVTDPKLEDLSPTQPWVDAEFEERIAPFYSQNPGKAYKLRPEVWDELLEATGRFSYTYGQRLGNQIPYVIKAIKNNVLSRQLFISVWDRELDCGRYDTRRVPCSLGYYYQHRSRKLNVTYLQRSCDFSTHYHNDAYLAVKMLHHIANEAGVEPGMFSHWIGSLHVFSRDVEGVF